MKKMKKLLCVLIAVVISCQFVISTNASSVSYDNIAARVTGMFDYGVTYSAEECFALYSASGNADYMLISLNPYGYVVYNLNTGGFEEIAPFATELPIDVSIRADFYYLGPDKYCYKRNGVLTDADSGLVMTNAELNNYQQILSIKQSYEQMQCGTQNSLNQNARIVPGVPTLPVTFETYYINNDQYFTTLLENNFGYNTQGTCTMVATAILLGYFDVYVNDTFVADEYRIEYGTTESFHQLMCDYINPNGGAGSISKAEVGVEEYLEDIGVRHFTASKIIGNHETVYEKVAEQISMNRPLVTAMFSSYNEDCPMNHSNVTYGYTIERHNQSGEVLSIYYHVHNGWKYNSENLKSYNYAWFADALYIEQTWEWI